MGTATSDRSANAAAGQLSTAAAEDEGVLAELRAELRGVVIAPGDPDYDAARTLHNAMIDKRPAAIARCTGVADVKAALGFGLAQGLELAVRGGGHNVAGKALCDGGLVIDLSALKGIRVDPNTRTVRAQPGLTWGEFDRETQAFGLSTTGGAVSSTGIAGLTLGGGIGWLQRKHGLTCDNLISADVVTADGRFSPDPPGWAEAEANRAGRSRSTTRARRTCGAGASGATGAAPPSTGRGDIRRVGGWPPLVTSRAEGAQLAAGPGCPRRPTGSLPGCRCARSPARRRW